MTVRVPMSPPVLEWAVERTQLPINELEKKPDFRSLRSWLIGEVPQHSGKHRSWPSSLGSLLAICYSKSPSNAPLTSLILGLTGALRCPDAALRLSRQSMPVNDA